jgi:hypothetical protein
MSKDLGEVYDLSYAKKAMAVLITLPVLVMYTEAVLIYRHYPLSRESLVSHPVMLAGFSPSICSPEPSA